MKQHCNADSNKSYTTVKKNNTNTILIRHRTSFIAKNVADYKMNDRFRSVVFLFSNGAFKTDGERMKYGTRAANENDWRSQMMPAAGQEMREPIA